MTLLQQRLYRFLVRLHPAQFRHDFGREMLLDFEDASAHTRFVTLYLDALISLGRQWLESSLSGGAECDTAQKASLLTGPYITFGDEPLSVIELGRGLLAALMLVALLVFAQSSRIARPEADDSATANFASPTGDAANDNPESGEMSSSSARAAAKPRELASHNYARHAPSPDDLSVTAYFLRSAAAAYSQSSQVNIQTPVPLLEVATIKPSDPAKQPLGLYWRKPDGFTREGTTLRGMIGYAYGVPSSVKGLLQGGPAWMASQAFDVQVKVDAATTERWSKLPQQAVDEERRAVERELLAERFHLKVHRERREMPAFLLTEAKGGSKLQTPVAEKDLQAGVPQSRINFYGRGHMQGHSALLSNLSRSLMAEPEAEGRPIVDKTGLAGQYDFTLRWTPADAPTDAGQQWPSLFTALEEQLGLKLTPGKAQLEIIVVDSVEKPSEN